MEGLKCFVTAVRTFEMLLLNTNPYAVIQIPFVRQYQAAARLRDSDQKHFYTPSL